MLFYYICPIVAMQKQIYCWFNCMAACARRANAILKIMFNSVLIKMNKILSQQDCTGSKWNLVNNLCIETVQRSYHNHFITFFLRTGHITKENRIIVIKIFLFTNSLLADSLFLKKVKLLIVKGASYQPKIVCSDFVKQIIHKLRDKVDVLQIFVALFG